MSPVAWREGRCRKATIILTLDSTPRHFIIELGEPPRMPVFTEANDIGYWCLLLKNSVGATDVGDYESAHKCRSHPLGKLLPLSCFWK